MASDVTQLGFLLFVSALVAMLTRRLHLPYTVGLVLAGMALYFLQIHIKWHLSKDLIFSVFLPPLIFEAALFIDWEGFKKDFPVITLLATVGVILAATVSAVGMHYALGWDWGTAVLFGALIAATDPVSVIATFKDAGVQGRLRLLIEAESLLNDGTAAVAFVSVLAMLTGHHQSSMAIGINLLVTVLGGTAVGALVGVSLMSLAGRTPDYLVELSFTVLAAYASFFTAEYFHFSGVLATLSAGLVVGNYRSSGSITQAGRHALGPFWEFAAFIANSLIFLLIGAQEAQQHFTDMWLSLLVAIVLVTLGRAVAIYPLCAIFAGSRLAVKLNHQHILFWGGLRGALALALALALPYELPNRDAIITVTFAVVAFSIFMQGLTITPLLKRQNLIGSDSVKP
jgi:CPA1 family monovalent cation:H+ antiporter